MKYVGSDDVRNEEAVDKAVLKAKLASLDWEFTKGELAEMIENEFFNDTNGLDTALVDLAVARMLLLDGISLDDATLQQEREKMIYGVLRRILKPEQ